MSFTAPPPPVFAGENYHIWVVKMKTYLQAQDLWSVVENDIEPPPLRANPTIAQIRQHAEESTKKHKALACLQNGVSDVIFTRIMACSTPKEAWERLKEEFMGSDKTRQQQVINLRRDFKNLKMKESKSIKQYSDRIMATVNSIRLLGEDFSDSRVVEKVITTLPERFESKISSLEDSRDLTTISLSELVNSLYALEQRRANRQEDHPEGAFQAKAKENSSSSHKGKKPWLDKRDKPRRDSGKRKFPPCVHCKKTTHSEKFCWFRPDIQCRNCKQFGHVEKVCKNKPKAPAQQQIQAQAVEDLQVQEEHVFTASCFVSSNKVKSNWLVDSGCTHHMAADESLFRDLDRSYVSKIRIGNGDLIQAKGKGNVVINTRSGNKVISDVLFVPDIDQNLLSVGQLVEKGYSLVFENGACVAKDTYGQELISVAMTDKCFMLNMNQLEKKAYTSLADNTDLWHRRLGHVNYRSLDLLHKMNMVDDMSRVEVKDTVCEVCQLGKQARLPFPANMAWRARDKLELVHSDVCGPMKNSSLNDSKYFVLFIDDLTRFCWVYFMKQKSEVFDAFNKFKALVENQSSCKIKALRTDNGSEYLSERFQKLCEESGIHHQLTNFYTPQQNGVCERKNRTVLNMARCLLFQSKLPSNFWAEAVNTSVYLLNRLPTHAVKDKTPFEAWHGLKPTVSHLKVFGCVCYAHIPVEKRNKLEERAVPVILVGYSSTKKGYRVYNPSTKGILISRDVKFDEDKIWSWNGDNAKLFEEDQSNDNLEPAEDEPSNEDFDDTPVRGTRTIEDIYQRCNVALLEPSDYEEAVKDKRWKKAMEAELDMIHKNETWELVNRPDHQKVIGVKWVFRTKYNADGSLNKYKARLVVKGYSQQYGIDFMETFAPVARLDTIKLLFALAAQKHWKVHQLDVKSAFLNGFLREEIFIEQPEGFKAPRAWYDRIDTYLSRLGFEKSVSEATLYVKRLKGETLLIVSLYVDDLLVTGSKEELINEFKEQMLKVFEMTDLGVMTYFLGMEVNQSDQGIFISQHIFALKILSKFCMANCKPVNTPVAQGEKLSRSESVERVDEKEYRSLVGCLLYLTATRPDIMFGVSLLSRFMHCCNVTHFKAAKRILRYVKGTLNHGVMFKKEKELKLIGYSDSDWAGSVDDMKSTSGYFFTLGSGVFCWSSKKQQTVAQSTAEAEYIAAAAAVNQAIWLRKLLSDLNEEQSEATKIMVDNQSAVAIAKNPVFHGKTKHFKIKLHFVREAEQSGEISLIHCSSLEQLANILTKPLGVTRFEDLRRKIGVCCIQSKEEC
ncbi:hypothetical protein CXB51_017032 [Gossypium anomalum]|uniref:Integrase catalytic domain-containing protein n=1 Tax=Gossypium anomalum TaxID=47600 RepID=A0A8J5ZII3_9ROSI|nr:hypothetical protein CXB51_017032 [Gossypium anomalum]